MLWGKEMGVAMEYSDAKTVTGHKQQGHWKMETAQALGSSD